MVLFHFSLPSTHLRLLIQGRALACQWQTHANVGKNRVEIVYAALGTHVRVGLGKRTELYRWGVNIYWTTPAATDRTASSSIYSLSLRNRDLSSLCCVCEKRKQKWRAQTSRVAKNPNGKDRRLFPSFAWPFNMSDGRPPVLYVLWLLFAAEKILKKKKKTKKASISSSRTLYTKERRFTLSSSSASGLSLFTCIFRYGNGMNHMPIRARWPPSGNVTSVTHDYWFCALSVLVSFLIFCKAQRGKKNVRVSELEWIKSRKKSSSLISLWLPSYQREREREEEGTKRMRTMEKKRETHTTFVRGYTFCFFFLCHVQKFVTFSPWLLLSFALFYTHLLDYRHCVHVGLNLLGHFACSSSTERTSSSTW